MVSGQAAEFDYAGTQACRALRAEGVRTILVNSNPATIMTDPSVADVIYLEPLTVEAVEAVIAREQPDGLLAGLGGQTALNLTAAMADAGVFDPHALRLLGPPLAATRTAEDREPVPARLHRIGHPHTPTNTVERPTPPVRTHSPPRRGKAVPESEPLYDQTDAAAVQQLMVGQPYRRLHHLRKNLAFEFTDAGHILGSASVDLRCTEGAGHRLVFSGDIGRTGLPIIRDPDPPTGPIDTLIIEST